MFDGRVKETTVVLGTTASCRRGRARPPRAGDARQRGRAVADRGGRWDARPPAERTRDGYGFLVLEGLLVRRVGIAERVAAELLGPGDLLRPLEHDGEEATLPFDATWRVLHR